MNPTLLQPETLGFHVVHKRNLGEHFTPSQSGYYILLGRRGTPDAPRERVYFIQYLDHFLEGCQRHIEALWSKHGVNITHVAVKLGRRLRPAKDLSEVYERAVTVQQLREKLQPRFRRL